MSEHNDAARRWTCDGCRVSVGQLDGSAVPLPDSWASSPEGDFCLACRRTRAAEAALDAAPPDSHRDSRASLRRDGLIEFEVRRTPELTNGMIARACRTSAATVAAARRRLRLPEGPAPGPDRDRPARVAARR